MVHGRHADSVRTVLLQSIASGYLAARMLQQSVRRRIARHGDLTVQPAASVSEDSTHDVEAARVAAQQQREFEVIERRLDEMRLRDGIERSLEALGAECSICLEALREAEPRRALRCAHVFHASCIDRWLQQTPRCPDCSMLAVPEPEN